MKRKILTALALAATALAAPPPSQAGLSLSQTAAPQASVTLTLSSMDRDCEDPQAATCFPSRLAAAIAAAPAPAPAADVLAAAAQGLRFARLEADLRGGEAPAFRRPQTKTFALLVGVSGYSAQPFAGTAVNLRLMESALRKAGFETRVLLDPTIEDFARAQSAWRQDLADASQNAQALVYLYGLGLEGERRFCLQTPTPSLTPDFWRDCLALSSFSAQDLAPSLLIVDAEFVSLRPQSK